jgi:hypothetical protein
MLVLQILRLIGGIGCQSLEELLVEISALQSNITTYIALSSIVLDWCMVRSTGHALLLHDMVYGTNQAHQIN